ncbi:MAG: hypothetical protein ABJG88_12725 [Litorimonas sp.]
MRILLLGVAAMALSGCSFLGIGGQSKAQRAYQNYNANAVQNVQQARSLQAQKNSCQGQCLARWNVEAAIGPEFVVDGSAITGRDTNDIAGVDINNISAANAYDQGWRAELGGSYALTPNRKVTATGFYSEADGNTRDIGTINGETLTGRLSDFQSFGAEVGLRQYFRPRAVPVVNSIRPYVEGRLGAARLSSVELENAQLGGAAFGAGDIDFYDSGWVGSAAGLVGVETPLTRYSTIGLETGIRYTQRPGSDNSDLEPGNPLRGANNGGARLSIPVMLRGRYRF